MEELKRIAREESRVIGGKPYVYRYWDSGNVKHIDILSVEDRPDDGVKSYATIGLSKHDINLESDGKDLRIELVGACDSAVDFYANIVATTAFEIMDKGDSCYGDIIDDVVAEYIQDSDMKHVYLMSPFLWDDLDLIEFPDKWVTWLMLVPISDKEKKYAIKHGYDALEDLFEENQIDVYDLYRKSIL